MLSESDLKRLEHGASRLMRQGVFVAFIFLALCVLAIGAGDIWLAARLAEIAHTQLWDIFLLKFDFNQSYPGSIVRAADLLSRGLRLISYGVVFLGFAFIFRAHARFYARLRAELRARDA